MTTVKLTTLSLSALVGGFFSALFGEWSAALTTLLIFMLIDYVSGMVVAGVFHKSMKSSDGSLESRAGWKGLCRKAMTLILVLVAGRIDIAMVTVFIRDAIVLAFIVNESISIIENATLMGIPIPEPLKNDINMLARKADKSDNEQDE